MQAYIQMLHAILSPHFDDAVLSCWSLLEGPDDVMVVNVFTASPSAGTPPAWWDQATGATDPLERMRERREEDAAALSLLDRPSLHLGLLDDQYRRTGLSAHQVAQRIAHRVDRRAKLHAPGAFDGHSDHVLVRDASLELARLGWRVGLYADLPHATVRGWPAWLPGEEGQAGSEVAAEWRRGLVKAGLVPENLVPCVHPLDRRVQARKLQAIAVYRTQRAGLDRLALLPLADPRALAWEVSWDLSPSALRAADELVGEAGIADSQCEPVDDPI
jgi:hypothetical protein